MGRWLSVICYLLSVISGWGEGELPLTFHIINKAS
jgi:hypothetical protein